MADADTRIAINGQVIMKLNRITSARMLILGICGTLAMQVAEATSCTNATLNFSTSALESVVKEPERVLAEEGLFWEEEPAQHFTRLWAEAVNHQIDYEKWRSDVALLMDLSEEERINHGLVRMTNGIVNGQKPFLKQALPYVCSYLPEGANLDVSIYFTAYIPARSFLWEGIVINVSAPYWHGNPDNIFNNLLHEIWHVGYAKHREFRTEEVTVDAARYDMLDTLHNEGFATHVGYRSNSIFHAPDEKDYLLLEDPDDVARLLRVINDLFAQVDVLSSDDLDRLTWDQGVIGRAFYVVGALMAQTIEDALGKQALIDTVSAGPINFINLYNSLANVDAKIIYQ